jgi:hypothetical protein
MLHLFEANASSFATWVAGTSPAMTNMGNRSDRSGSMQGEIPNCRVGRGRHLPIRDMFGLVPPGDKPTGERRWKLCIDDEPHQAIRNTG